MNQHAIDLTAIQSRAYARWQQRGCPVGSPEDDWFEAERELLEARAQQVEPARPAPTPTATAAKAAQPAAPDAAKRPKPPRPTLKRTPAPRAAKLLNEVTPKAPATRAAAPATSTKRSAVG